MGPTCAMALTIGTPNLLRPAGNCGFCRTRHSPCRSRSTGLQRVSSLFLHCGVQRVHQRHADLLAPPVFHAGPGCTGHQPHQEFSGLHSGQQQDRPESWEGCAARVQHMPGCSCMLICRGGICTDLGELQPGVKDLTALGRAGMIIKASNGVVTGNTVLLPKLPGIMFVPGGPSCTPSVPQLCLQIAGECTS